MKIEFKEEEKQKLRHLIDEYTEIDLSYMELKKKTDELDNRMKSLKEEEDSLMKTLKQSYGDFTLQDISDSLYVGE